MTPSGWRRADVPGEEAWAFYQTHSLNQTARHFHVCPRLLARHWRATGRVVRSAEATWAVKPRRAPTEREQSIGWYASTHTLRATGREFAMSESGVRSVLRRLGLTPSRRRGFGGMARLAVTGRARRTPDGRFLPIAA